MLAKVEATLPSSIRQQQRSVLPSEREVAEAPGFTEWDRDKSEMEMLSMMRRPPFAPQPANSERFAQLQQKWTAPERIAGLHQHIAQYETALQRDREDPELREMVAELLSRSGDNRAAAPTMRGRPSAATKI